MKAVIVDDHALVREGIVQVLKGCEDISEVIEAASHADLLSTLDAHPDIGIILLDINMSDVTTVETLIDLRECLPNVAVVILSANEDPAEATDFLNNGAAGYIPKSASNEVLLNAIGLILADGVYVPPFVLSGKKHDERITQPGNASPKMTNRQYEVLELMVQGMSNKGIARELRLSESTVKTHVSAILEAFGVDNRTKAVGKAIRQGSVVEP